MKCEDGSCSFGMIQKTHLPGVIATKRNLPSASVFAVGPVVGLDVLDLRLVADGVEHDLVHEHPHQGDSAATDRIQVFQLQRVREL